MAEVPDAAPGSAPVAGALNYQLLRLSALQMLQRRARDAERAELGFVMVNETMQVLSYQQSAFWDARRGVTAVSGAERAEQGAPYVRWLRLLMSELARSGSGLREVGASDVSPAIGASWNEWLPPCALWCPFPAPRGRTSGGLLLARQEPWGEGDREIADALSSSYAQSFVIASLPRRLFVRPGRRKSSRAVLTAGGVALLAALGALPVRESVLAPAEIVPQNPAFVRAPFAGVLESVDVPPNAPVHAGQVVATMNRRQLQTQADVASKALDMAQAEYLQATQQAVSDPKARSKVALLSSKVEEQRAELAYQNSLLSRAAITAPADGLAVYGDPSEWIGKPVETGERIMLVDPPESLRLEIHVPVSEAVTFEVGSEVVFFDNVTPDHPHTGRVDFASYSSAMTADGVMAYSFRAQLEPAGVPGEGAQGGLRLGLKGTGKIMGLPRPLALWVLRKPIMTVRQWLAL
jgi:hypothetical protein